MLWGHRSTDQGKLNSPWGLGMGKAVGRGELEGPEEAGPRVQREEVGTS